MLEHYYRELLNFCARTVKDRDAAADVVQESYARVLAIQRSSVPISEPRALLYQTARNVMVDQHRRGLLRRHDDLNAMAEADHPAMPAHLEPHALVASAQAIEVYMATIEALPPRCREAFILHVLEGLSQAEIARRMGTSVSMVEKHIARGRLECRASQRLLQGISVTTGALQEK
ncbi:MAG: sigma-70 family RNA polymerase sigma factor [Curvibacter lanceolatus]|uniref:sigma-70 family RNA polymerase sigma factor n=1 Tax=Curvibacter lanceolatus TaxID=86182 RepID=UPI0003754C69|nr:sigma-70 family RNA polymerase sigma factor [Curvibacter lanceolatus]MBV5294622.1 sigma-70 family RNA polymerase sigma factor [Curvibacter lanceolatus]